MDEYAPNSKINLIELTCDIASAYVGNNTVQPSAIPELIRTIQSALVGLGQEGPAPRLNRPVPPVSIRKSVSDDYLVSLEDGRRYKSLKRHLSGRGLTPVEYREKWGLPRDYPMVAPNYAKQRSELAKSLGLGQQRRKKAEAAPAPAAAPKRRGRPKANASA